MDEKIFIGRQPIFDANGQLYGYELLFRDGTTNVTCIVNNLLATVRVIINALNNIGIKSLLGGKLGFLNVDRELLFSDTITLLPPKHFILEILESVRIDTAIIERIRELKALGYRFAVDDFNLTREMFDNFAPIFEMMLLVKVDLHDINKENLKALKKIKQPLLAEKVESKEELDLCKKLGFSYFQGYFFERPSVLESKNIDPGKIIILKLISMIGQDRELPELIKEFEKDSKLTYNLLKYINSAKHSFRTKISSLTQAVSLLGKKGLQSWLEMFLYMGASSYGSDNYAEALYENTVIRSMVLHSYLEQKQSLSKKTQISLVATLSLIDALLNLPMDKCIEHLNLEEALENALLHYEGALGEGLLLAKYLETDQNHKLDLLCKKLDITPSTALSWYERCLIDLEKEKL